MRRRRAILYVVVAVTLPCASAAAPTLASTGSGAGGIGSGADGGTLTVGLTVSADGSPGVSASSAAAYRPYTINMFPIGDHTINAAGLCANPSGFQGLGWNWDITVISNATGLVVSHRIDCIALPDPTLPGPPVTSAPAQPPSIGDIWQTAAIENPTPGVSPAREGVTGLDTWIWSTGPNTVVINATINGWSVSGTAVRTGYVFDGDDGVLRMSTDGGSATHPAFTHVFETKGNRALRVASQWSATLTMTGPGLPPTLTNIGQATLTAQLIYPVVEVRSTLTK